MIIKVCDFCKINDEVDPLRLPINIATLEVGRQEGWEFILGKKRSFEICDHCFNRILKELSPEARPLKRL